MQDIVFLGLLVAATVVIYRKKTVADRPKQTPRRRQRCRPCRR